ncbi:MAG: asparagine--tRNA ligase [Acidobacteria bacterium]|nr:MAG: asparagine--tRNA ligase [Acidobacteriota bacterium]
MPFVYINEISKFQGQEVTVKGWLYNIRSSGKIIFPILRDGTGLLQAIVLKNAVSPELFERAKELTQESSLEVTGTVRKVPEGKTAPGGHELDVKDLKIGQLIPADQPFPITPKEHGIEFLMDYRHLWIRSSRQHAILKVRHEIIRAVRNFFDDRGFTLVDTPIFTPAACEGTTTLFEVGYFDEKAYLTQSGQLYNEATAAAFGKVYCFGPTFRAEKSKTRRHLTEFWMVEPEVAYATLEDIMALAEDFITHIVKSVLQHRRSELEVLERDISKLEGIEPPFPRVSYDEAVQSLKASGSNIEWGGDFGGADETLLSQQYDRPILVHRYPAQVKAFYMEPDANRPELALCVDVLAPEGYGEIIGGGQRASRLELVTQRIQEHQLPPEAFDWYLDLRKYGTFPHAGFGMGIERAVAWICGLEHVRETIPFPRMLYRLRP